MQPGMQGMQPGMQGMQPGMQGMQPGMQGMQPGMQGMQGMGNIGGPAMPMMTQMAPKEGVEHISAADLLTVPTAQVLRLPDGHTVTVPFPPTPPEAPLEVDPAEIRATAMIDHAADILKVLGGLASNKSAAKTLQSFAKSEHLPKNFVQDWQKHPEKFEAFIQSHAGDPNLGKITTLMQKDHEGAQVVKDIAADIDSSLQSYNDEVTQYEAEYEQYQQAFMEHLTTMKSEILPQLVAAGVIPEAQANHLMANLADNGGSIDFSEVAPDALVQESDGPIQGTGDNSTDDGIEVDDSGLAVDDGGATDFTQVAAGSPDAPAQDSTAPSGDGGGSDFLASFMATLNSDSDQSSSGSASSSPTDSSAADSSASDSSGSGAGSGYTDSSDSSAPDSGSSGGDNVDWSSVGYDSSAAADDNSAPSDPASSSGDNSTNG